MSSFRKLAVFSFLITLLAGVALSQAIRVDSQESPERVGLNRSRGISMLKDIRTEIKRRYYDKNYHGVDLDATFKKAEARIKQLSTNSEIFQVIAAFVLELEDSHTFFVPPGRANQTFYGFSMQMVGNTCFVMDVKSGSDAEKKGLKTGDVVVGIGRYAVERQNLWLIRYIMYQLDPAAAIKITRRGPNNSAEELIIESTVVPLEERLKEERERRKRKQEDPYKCHAITAELIACRLETFSVDKKFINKMMEQAAPYKKMILDLRGNSGGYVKIEQYLLGHFFDREVAIGRFVMRNKEETRTAAVQKKNNFSGDLIVLIDSLSASASEVFARVMQLEKRATVVGDVSSGAVMTSISGTLSNTRGVPGYQTISLYRLSITVGDLIMPDGGRLEKAGVIPDHPVGPTAQAIRSKSDPVLSYAADLLGTSIAADKAGELGFLKRNLEGEDDRSDEDDN